MGGLMGGWMHGMDAWNGCMDGRTDGSMDK